MKIKNVVLVLFFLGFIGWAWQYSTLNLLSLLPHSNAQAKEKKEEPVVSQRNVIRDLPCFKCHIYERFMQEPAPGVFSHALHTQFDFHCNQCHSFRGHRQMVINTSVCTFCHEKVPQLSKTEP